MGGIAEPTKPLFPSDVKQPGALPNLNPPAPALEHPGAVIPTSIKPTAGNESRPAAPEFAPKTTFDVDIHTVTSSDSYKTISREFYNDDRFAAALSAYNQDRLIRTGDRVDVPPIHVLKRKFPQMVGGGAVQPASGSRNTAPSQPEWNNAAPRPVTNGRSVFTVPNGNGMTLRQIARQTMGSEQRWSDIYDLNKISRPDEVLAPGTELKMPTDARLP
ncbi:LysM peptidoglycan-binding domain-containing protein [Gemmata massiliana]|nr:LysM peptidoglycan-binding domain-containing protein [Gemmata massiliana]